MAQLLGLDQRGQFAARLAEPEVLSSCAVPLVAPKENRDSVITPWQSKTKQRMVFGIIHVKDSLLPMGKVWSLDFQGTVIMVRIVG